MLSGEETIYIYNSVLIVPSVNMFLGAFSKYFVTRTFVDTFILLWTQLVRSMLGLPWLDSCSMLTALLTAAHTLNPPTTTINFSLWVNDFWAIISWVKVWGVPGGGDGCECWCGVSRDTDQPHGPAPAPHKLVPPSLAAGDVDCTAAHWGLSTGVLITRYWFPATLRF